MRCQFKAGSCPPAPVARNKLARKSPHGALLHRGAVTVAALLALAGCATSVEPGGALAWKVEPLMLVKHGAQSSAAYYALGRYHDGSQAWDKAADAYRKAIAADARNVEAYNALGVALARSHRLELRLERLNSLGESRRSQSQTTSRGLEALPARNFLKGL